ncbi:MAG: response regulator FixJ [Pseudolabrys sp.]
MTPDQPIYVVDDDDAVRNSLEFLLQAAGYKTTCFTSATAFLERLPQVDGGCIVTDVRMPGLSGIDLLKAVAAAKPNIPVIVITGHGDIALAVEAMKIGAADFLEKPFDDEALLSTIAAALKSTRNAPDPDASGLRAKIAALSGRERQVLDGLVVGKPNKIIAHDLGISPRTVEVYRANLMTKMEAGSLSDLVRMALRAGILD